MRKMIFTIALALPGLALLGATGTQAAQFTTKIHDAHVEDYAKEGGCPACHVATDRTIKPAEDTCKKCHDEKFLSDVTYAGTTTHGPLWSFQHGPDAKREYKKCEICHDEGKRKGSIGCTDCHEALAADEQGDFANAMNNVHRSEFKVSHPIAARTDPQLCEKCHSNNYCVECHEAFRPEDLSVLSHRKGFSTGLSPSHEFFSTQSCQTCHVDSVLPEHEWSNAHKREARRNLSTCQACHPDGDVCLKCHSARSGLGVSPHPEDWKDGMDSRLRRASDGKTCRKCH